MGFLQTKDTGKEKQSQALSLLREQTPIFLQLASDFVTSHFNSEEVDKRRDAHKLWSKIIDKALPNMQIIQREDTGHISEDLADFLKQALNQNNDKLNKAIEIEVEEVEDETGRVPENNDAKRIYKGIR